MRYADDANPVRHEVERQLQRMLAHPLFAARPQQARLFEFLVRSALDEKEVTEKDIRAAFFPTPPYSPESTVARTTVNFIRGELLREYYDGEGKDDPVLIALPDPKKNKTASGKSIKLPPGTAYKPAFSYNPRHDIAKEFALAQHFLRGTPSQITDALLHLAKVEEMEPDQPDTVLAAIEAYAIQMLLGMPEDERKMYLEAGFDCLARIAPRVPDYWRIHVVRGLLYCADGYFETAKREFDAALALDRESTRRSDWYSYLLFRTGREEEAIQIEADDAAEGVADAGAQAAHGILLCHAHRFEEAERALKHALEIDRNCWTARYGMTLLLSETGRQWQALEESKRLESLLEREDFEILMRRLGLKPREE
jgi:tetratricopeptide (TPR) repeat protein